MTLLQATNRATKPLRALKPLKEYNAFGGFSVGTGRRTTEATVGTEGTEAQCSVFSVHFSASVIPTASELPPAWTEPSRETLRVSENPKGLATTAVSDTGVGGVEYQAQRATNSSFSSGVVTSEWIDDLSYTFDQADTASGTYTVTLRDGIGRQSSVDFSVIRDTTPPTLTLEAVVQSDVLVTWNVEDSGSGVDASTCLLEVSEDEVVWQTFSTLCEGEDATYDGQPGHTHTFRLSASDNVSNAASTEVEAVVPYVKKYYYANGQRVAMQQGGVVYYVHSDHLGSTSILSDENGQQVTDSRVAYLPYGGLRLGDASTLPTDYTFTGQRLEAGIGLMHYGARFYSPRLGRFISADTIVPQPGEPQAAQWPLRVGTFKPQDIARVGEENRQIAQYGFWFQRGPEARQETVHPTGPTNPQELNRYAYCLGNPLRYVDPSGEQTGVVEAIVAFVFISIAVVPPMVLIGAHIKEKYFSDDHDEPLAAPEPSPPSTPEGTPQGGFQWPPPTSTTTPTPIPFFLPLATRIPEQSIRARPTATVTPPHSPALDGFIRAMGGHHGELIEPHEHPPEPIYGHHEPILQDTLELWYYDMISGQKIPR